MGWFITHFTSISGWCSILGFVLSFLVLLTVRNIRTHYWSKGRIPEIIKELDNKSKKLNGYLEDDEKNKYNILTVLKEVEFSLKSLKQIDNKDIVEQINKMLKRLKNLKKDGPIWSHLVNTTKWSFKEEIWEFYTDMLGILQGLKEHERDSNWRE
jgi:hypothetical protein